MEKTCPFTVRRKSQRRKRLMACYMNRDMINNRAIFLTCVPFVSHRARITFANDPRPSSFRHKYSLTRFVPSPLLTT